MAFYETWGPYVPVAERRRRAEKLIQAQSKKGQPLSPVQLSGRALAQSFWGQAWCQHLESYSDFESRLPRGRAYVRNGSVIDLKISAGTIAALVQGTNLYRVRIEVKPVAKARWQELCRRCAGGLGSLVELLSGRLSCEVMSVVTDRAMGLFPAPAEIKMSCSCPDWATMCKHVAATLYGAGARFDTAPELLFTLRNVDPTELVTKAGAESPVSVPATADVLGAEVGDLGALFGIDLADTGGAPQTSAVEHALPSPEPSAKREAAVKRRQPLRKKPASPRLKNKSRRTAQLAAAQQEQVAAMKKLLKRLQQS